MKVLLERRRLLKKKLQHRQKIFAGWTSLFHPSIAEIFARANMDFIGIDLEHSTISQEQSQHIISVCQGSGTLCLPRLASHNVEMARRLLDSGADGLIVPMVSRGKEVEEIIAWSKYPPQGKRGFGISRAQGYGFDFDEYVQNWNDTSILIVQIESIEAVNNIKTILSYPQIDGVMIGPYDISGSLGIPGQLTHKKVLQASEKVLQACRKFHKSCGTQIIEPDLKKLEQAFATGYTFTILASDIFVLWKWTQRIKEYIENFR